MKLKETETVEGRPVIKGSDEYWKTEFKKQRKDRLQDSVDEYMQDGEITDFYNDLTDAIQSLIDYHEKQKEYAVTAMKAVSGHRPFEIDTSLDDVNPDDKYFQRKYNLAEAEYYDKRAQLDGQQLPERY